MDFIENLSLWIGGAAVMLAGISVGGLIAFMYLKRKSSKQHALTPSLLPKSSRISGLDVFELPDSMRNRK